MLLGSNISPVPLRFGEVARSGAAFVRVRAGRYEAATVGFPRRDPVTIRSGMRQDESDLPRIRPPHHLLLGARREQGGRPLSWPPASRFFEGALGGGSSTGYSQPPLKARLRLSERPRVLRRGAGGVAAARRPRRPRLHSGKKSPVEPVGDFPTSTREQFPVPIGRDPNRRLPEVILHFLHMPGRSR
jgi:hypothetical protein